MLHLLSPAFAALLQVILIDIVLAGDNAVVIGIAAARVPLAQRRRVIFWGLVVAVVLRIFLASTAALLLTTIGLMFAGGVLLLWVATRLYRDFSTEPEHAIGSHTFQTRGDDHPTAKPLSQRGMRHAIFQIVLADVSMSLDNVLAVAGAAMHHVWVLGIGLILSVALMGVAASMIARLLDRHPWISYAGLILVVYVALRMIYIGGMQIMQHAPIIIHSLT